MRIRFEVDAAAMAAVSAGRPASRHEFFATERDAAVSAVAGLYVDFGFIDEHHESLPPFRHCRTATPGCPCANFNRAQPRTASPSQGLGMKNGCHTKTKAAPHRGAAFSHSRSS